MNNEIILSPELLTKLVSEENFINDLSGKLYDTMEYLKN